MDPKTGGTMFERIGVGTGRCDFCGTYGLIAVLQHADGNPGENVEACERCIRAAQKAADLLKVLRQAKAKPPKKARNRAQSRASGPLPHPRPQDTTSLVPQAIS